MNKGDFFGEQALLNHCVRTATIIAKTDVKIICLGRNAIIKALGDNLESILYRNTIRMTFLKSPFFSKLTDDQLKKVIEKMKITVYQDNEKVILKGLPIGQHI